MVAFNRMHLSIDCCRTHRIVRSMHVNWLNYFRKIWSKVQPFRMSRCEARASPYRFSPVNFTVKYSRFLQIRRMKRIRIKKLSTNCKKAWKNWSDVSVRWNSRCGLLVGAMKTRGRNVAKRMCVVAWSERRAWIAGIIAWKRCQLTKIFRSISSACKFGQ